MKKETAPRMDTISLFQNQASGSGPPTEGHDAGRHT